MSDVPRRQGWVVVGACSLVMFGVWNSHAGFGVFLPALAKEFGWSRGAISVAPSLNLIVGGLIAFVIGAASDRWGPRLILTTSAVLTGVRQSSFPSVPSRPMTASAMKPMTCFLPRIVAMNGAA